MNWLIIQSDGEHRGQDGWAANWFLRECYSFQDALIRCGHTADIWGLRHSNFLYAPNWENYDYILIAENYEMDWIPATLRIAKRPKIIQWVIDLHCQRPEVYLKLPAHYYLHATETLLASFAVQAPEGTKHIWFPNAIDDRYFKPADREKDIDILFIGGGGPQRQPAIDHMVKECRMVYKYGVTGYDYIEMLRRAKVGFNISLNGDINYRTFEILAVGTCLLTPYDPCLPIVLGFQHALNCLMYHNLEQAAFFAKMAIQEKSYKSIGQAGCQLSKQHTYEQRVRNLLKQL